MASIILKTYLSSDIVDYCILPYLIVPKDDVEKNQEAMVKDYHKMLLITELLNVKYKTSDPLLPSHLKDRSIGLAKWCLNYHNYINRQNGKKLIY